MRLVTWNLGHRLDGGHTPDDVVTALAALEPDIAILTGSLPGPARRSFLESLAGLGLKHQLAPEPGQPGSDALVASRVELVPGLLESRTTRDPLPPNLLHAYAPTGVLDVLGMTRPMSGVPSARRRSGWESVLRAAATLKHRRAILIGDFAVDERADRNDHLRQLIDAGWKHAVPAEGASYRTGSSATVALDHAFLSPSIQVYRHPLRPHGRGIPADRHEGFAVEPAGARRRREVAVKACRRPACCSRTPRSGRSSSASQLPPGPASTSHTTRARLRRRPT